MSRSRRTKSLARKQAKPRASEGRARAEEDDEATRLELERRLLKLAEADNDLASWEIERDTYEANMIAAIGNGIEPPAPLRPHPCAPMAARDYLSAILKGEV